MTPVPLPTVAGLPTYGVGRAAEPPRYALASNESVHPPTPHVVDAVTRAAATANRYPPLRVHTLEERLAQRLGVPAGTVLAGGGSVALLELLVRAFAGTGRRVVYPWRSYEAYPIVVGAAGATAVEVPLHEGAADPDALAVAVTSDVSVVIVCNPNNPTGGVLPPGALRRLVEAVPRRCLVVVDEAYREFVDPGATDDGVALTREFSHVAVLRTFSKAYGLAGLRVGYCIADPTVLDAARRVALPFTVSGPALAGALACLDEPEVAVVRCDEVRAERDRLSSALRRAGLTVPESHGNFVWLPLGEGSEGFARACSGAGVGVRLFVREGVRITIGSPAAHGIVADIAVGSRMTRTTDGAG